MKGFMFNVVMGFVLVTTFRLLGIGFVDGLIISLIGFVNGVGYALLEPYKPGGHP